MLWLKRTGLVFLDVSIKVHNSLHLFLICFWRFRTFVIALTADIEKAFLQISINPNDRNYLRFLWFEDVFAKVPKIFRNRFSRVLFGMSCSSYLLNGTVQKHAKTYDFHFELINKVVNCCYVDNFFGGENSFKKGFELYKKIISDSLKVYFFCENGG